MNIYTSETEFLKTEVQRLSALVRAQQITIDKLEAQPAPYMAVSTDRMNVDPHTGNVSIGTVAQPAPVQEPVAEIQEDMKGGGYVKWLSEDFFVAGTKLYTTPPAQRTWVGLTNEEKQEIWAMNETAMVISATEAKLKDKNNAV